MWSSEAPETETVQAGEIAPEPTGTGWLRSLIGWSCSVEVGLTHREGPDTEAVQAGEIALELTGTGWLRSLIGWSCSVEVGLTRGEGITPRPARRCPCL